VAKDRDFEKIPLTPELKQLTKPSFKNNTNYRCLIIATAYHEWRWLDPKGKAKQKYQINSQEDEIFTFAGLYSTWATFKRSC
jgi:putative SOS response-associated peptidase YedK